MKVTIISVGRQHEDIYKDAINTFTARILRYTPLEWLYLDHDANKDKECEKIFSLLKKEDYVILLDERGTLMKSEEFAGLIEHRMVDGVKRIIFIIGGAYGVNEKIKTRANYTLKLSSFVFPHMLVRLILAEQLYRALTILRGEKYHHE